MRVISLAAMALIGITQVATAQDYSAEEVAAAILTGFVERDVARIAQHSNAVNVDFFNGLASGEIPASELFDDPKGQAAIAWDGMILPARYAPNSAYVAFAIEGPNGPAALGSGQPGRYMALVLELDGPEDTTWGLEDVNYFERAEYIAHADTRP